MTPTPLYAPFVAVFTPFAILLTAGNLYAEMGPNLDLGRVVATILLCGAFALPAVLLFLRTDLRAGSPLLARYWQLLWSFGFAAYALHVFWSAGVWFEWDFAQMIRRQTLLVTIVNWSLLLLWFGSALASWFGPSRGGRTVWILHWTAHLLFVVAFFTAAVVFQSAARSNLSLAIGILLSIVTVLALTVRWWK